MGCFTFEIPEEFAEKLKERYQVYLELNDGRKIPVSAMPVAPADVDPSPIHTITVKFSEHE